MILMIIEEKEFDVVLILRLHSRIYFGPIERDSEITEEVAIDDAMKMIKESTWADMRENFEVEIDYDIDEV